MVIIIGGHSCSGKTFMAQKLLERYKIPYYSVDHLKMGIFRSNKSCGFTPTDSNEHIGRKLWPIIQAVIMTAIENDQDIIIEGCYILPEFIGNFDQDYLKDIIPIFIGFSEDYIKTNFESHIIKHRSIIERRDYPEERSISDFIKENRNFEDRCQQHNLPYFKVYEDYTDDLEKAYDYIDSHLRKRSSTISKK